MVTTIALAGVEYKCCKGLCSRPQRTPCNDNDPPWCQYFPSYKRWHALRTMKVWHTIGSFVAVAGLVVGSAAEEWPLHDNGLNKLVEWYDADPVAWMITTGLTKLIGTTIVSRSTGRGFISGPEKSVGPVSELSTLHAHTNADEQLHLWRIPVPELWRDVFEKIKAAGYV